MFTKSNIAEHNLVIQYFLDFHIVFQYSSIPLFHYFISSEHIPRIQYSIAELQNSITPVFLNVFQFSIKVHQ